VTATNMSLSNATEDYHHHHHHYDDEYNYVDNLTNAIISPQHVHQGSAESELSPLEHGTSARAAKKISCQ